ncbi:MAG: substrate-binding domain-containing protein [Verrucomicrobiales bacterium]|nr:substrate-binding domain-containing protein [Verrucomicrobiales bacterium]
MIRRLLLFFLLILGLAAGLTWMWQRRSASPASESGLQVFCAAGLKVPVEAAAKAFEQEKGIPVHLQFGGTATLLSQLQVAGRGDLFIAADEGSLRDATDRQLTRERIPLAVQTPVIAVAKGNPKAIHGLADLTREGIRFACANPEAASIGKITRRALGDQWPAFAARAAVMKPTVTEIATDLRLGAVDAAIVWDSLIPQFQELEAVTDPALTAEKETASIAVLSACQQPATALAFARFLSAPERGNPLFAEAGFHPVPGDSWAKVPQIVLFSGGVNRTAIEPLVKAFAEREGLDLTTVFNGCGILCASMKTMGGSSNPKFPDVYYACDVCFVPPVAEQFPEAVMLTETRIGIAVPKGNPKSIRTLADLGRPGLRIGLCNAEQSTIGYMTHAILRSMNLLDAVTANAAAQVPTADFLINQMRAGALDAAVVYEVNVMPQKPFFDFIPLPADKARAIQPFAIRKDTAYRLICQRLLDDLRAHSDAFEDSGFRWTGQGELVKSADIQLPPWLQPEASQR